MSNNNSPAFSNYDLHALLLVDGIGSVRLRKLVHKFPGLEEIWQATPRRLEQSGLTSSIIKNLKQVRAKFDRAQEIQFLKQNKIKLVSIFNEDYPPLLKEIYDPPPLLYLKGDVSLLRSKRVSLVGTRQCSTYALRITRKLLAELAGKEICTVSGLARGVDYCVHSVSLEFDIPTIAVLGCGLCSFKGNGQKRQRCFEDITQKGLVISEFPPNGSARPQNFPLRNRVISGLAQNLVVVEAPQKSGALITAANALDQNRNVIALPGPIDNSNSLGGNTLIKDGAEILLEAKDLPQLLGCTTKTSVLRSDTDLGIDAQKIRKALTKQPLTFDKLILKTKLKPSRLNTLLSKLILQGLVQEDASQTYSNS